MQVKMYSVYSGNLNKIGWYSRENEKGQTEGVLRAEFRNETQYDYWPVSNDKFREIFSEDSKGSWFDREIKKNSKIKYEKVKEIE